MIRLHTSGRGRYVHRWRTPLIKVKRCVSFCVFRTSETLRCVLPTSLGLGVNLTPGLVSLNDPDMLHKPETAVSRRSAMSLICFSKVWFWKHKIKSNKRWMPHRQSGVSTQALSHHHHHHHHSNRLSPFVFSYSRAKCYVGQMPYGRPPTAMTETASWFFCAFVVMLTLLQSGRYFQKKIISTCNIWVFSGTSLPPVCCRPLCAVTRYDTNLIKYNKDFNGWKCPESILWCKALFLQEHGGWQMNT